MKNIKKTALALLMVFAIVAGTVGATVAWMTAESNLSNVFTVGKFTDPDPSVTPDPGPELPEPGEGEEKPEWPKDPETDPRLDGNLYEPHWDPEKAELVPGATIPKDPYVGIGPESEDAYVYIYVKPNMPNEHGNIGFYINEGWAPVEDYVDWNAEYAKADDNTTGGRFYTEGLFVYTGASGTDGAVGYLATPADGSNRWTKTPLFSEVVVQTNATAADLGTGEAVGEKPTNTIDVKAFIHQKTSGDGTTDLADTAKNAAIAKFFVNSAKITDNTNDGYSQTKSGTSTN